jgi:acetyltransferase
MPEFKDLSSLLDPQSIAIVGASPKENAWPARIWANLRRFRYPGKIYPVNPRYDTIWEQKCYASLDELPEVVDNAIIIVPAPTVVELLKQSRLSKFRAATILSGGFGEGNDREGKERKEFLQIYARERKVRFCGPNCMGLVSTRSRAVLSPDLRLPSINTGGLAVVSQSGGVVGSLVRAILDRGLGFRYFISSGNEIDVELCDYLNELLKDSEVKAIAAIVEGVKDAEKFVTVAQRALAQAKPVLILKIGRSPKGMDATLAHTGALAGDDRMFDALCYQNGIIRVRDLDELLNTAELFLRQNRLPSGPKAAFVTFSGGLRGMLADMAHDVGLELPELNPNTQRTLSTLLGVGASVGNPLDSGWGGLSSQETYLKCVSTILDDPGIHMLAISEDLPRSDVRPDKESNLLALAQIAKHHAKPITVFSLATQGVNDYGMQFKERCPLPFLEEVFNTVMALKHLGDFGGAVRKFKEGRFKQDHTLRPIGPREKDLLISRKVLNEWESYQVIAQFGLPLAKMALVSNLQEVARAAIDIGYPVVVKLVAPGMTHKTELGAVRVNLRSTEEVELAAKEMECAFRKASPYSGVEGFLVQEMVLGGIDTIIGSVNDPQFGPAVMFGLGGEFVEIYQDVLFRIAPVSQKEAMEMIHSIKGFPLLTGFRGRPPLDLETLSRAIVSVSELAVVGKELIQSIDVNPFIPLEQGGKAVDAVIIARQIEN